MYVVYYTTFVGQSLTKIQNSQYLIWVKKRSMAVHVTLILGLSYTVNMDLGNCSIDYLTNDKTGTVVIHDGHIHMRNPFFTMNFDKFAFNGVVCIHDTLSGQLIDFLNFEITGMISRNGQVEVNHTRLVTCIIHQSC